MSDGRERDIELIREAYRRWNEEGVDAFLEMVDEDADWQPPSYAPEPGPYRGREEIRAGLSAYFDTFDEFRPTPQAMYETGEPGRYLVLVSTFTRGKASGVETTIDVGHLITVDDGRLMRLEVHPDRGDAFEAAGLDPGHLPADLAAARLT